MLICFYPKFTDILTWNENGKTVIHGDDIPRSNFKFLLKSMVSNQQNLN